MKKYAVVDIGTNSARLMTASITGRDVKAEYKTLRTIRVGEGMIADQRITAGAMQRTVDTLKEYLSLSSSCDDFFCFATSAVRDAVNKQDYLEYVKENCGVDIDIISGEDEAFYGFAGSVKGCGGMFDIGGGSTEVITGSLGDFCFSHSFNIGTVRCLQMFPAADSADPEAYKKAHELAATTFEKVPAAHGFNYIGIGGTATALAAIDQKLKVYDASLVQDHVVSILRVAELCEMLKSKTKEQRKGVTGLENTRADVAVFGAIIMLEFLKASKSECVAISDRDNQEGYLLKKLGLI